MGIKLECPNGHKLHVKSFLAGKRGICPHCGEKFWIPGNVEEAATTPDDTSASPMDEVGDDPGLIEGKPAPSRDRPVQRSTASLAEGPLESRPEAVWYVRPASGGQFGPAEVELMRSWLSEGRVPPDSLVWRDDWESWQRADQAFAHLAPHAAADTSSPTPPERPAGPEQAQQAQQAQQARADSPGDRVSTAERGPAASVTELTAGRRRRATKKSRTTAVVVMLAVAVILFVLFLVVVLF